MYANIYGSGGPGPNILELPQNSAFPNDLPSYWRSRTFDGLLSPVHLQTNAKNDF